jgi:glycosyltransferase involved in cell wall biosynthesis
LAALEAMASGVPVVSTNVGGLSEINIPGVTGFMANVGDIETMSKQALNILSDDSTLNDFKQRSRDHAKKYDIHNIVPYYEKLYERFLVPA